MSLSLVIIGDLEQSRKMDPARRKATQKSLESVLNRINSNSDDILSAYTIVHGDEFQAVYQSADDLFSHIWAIMAEIHPVMVRFSIGVGTLSTEVNRQNALAMDGPAFHKAREQINLMKKEKLLLSVSTDDGRFDRLVNSTFRILGASLRSWKTNRFIILNKLYEGKEVKQIAHETGLSDVAVYKNIHAGTLEAVQELTRTISEMINDYIHEP
ncbi:MAG: SatD family protein [Balneolaceae bacterium]